MFLMQVKVDSNSGKQNVQGKEGMNKQLFDAIERADVEGVRLALKNGADVNAKGQYGSPPLISALSNAWDNEIASKMYEIARLLVESGADVNAKNRAGETALMYAWIYDIAKLLIDNGADVNAKNKSGESVLTFYMSKEYDNNVPGYKYDASKVLHADYYNICKMLIEKGADVNAKDRYGETVLLKAINQNNLKTAALLIDKGANVNAKDGNGKTALMHDLDYEMAKLLIDRGADVNAKNNYGETALMFTGKYSVAKLLVDRGADVNATRSNYEEMKPFIEQIKNSANEGKTLDPGSFRALLGSAKMFDGETVLMVQSSGYDANIVRLLIEKGADVNAKEKINGMPVLAFASSAGIAKVLIEKGADVNAKDDNGKTVLEYAGDHPEIVKLLKKNGAK